MLAKQTTKKSAKVFSPKNMMKLFWAVIMIALFILGVHYAHQVFVPILAIVVGIIGNQEYKRTIELPINDSNIQIPKEWFIQVWWIGKGSSVFAALGIHEHGNILVFLLAAVTFGCDFSANVIGVLARGRITHMVELVWKVTILPPFPESPNKTWEGTIGGIAATVPISWFVGTTYGLNLPWFAYLLAIPFGVFAVAGDLMASRIKRRYGIKDFSKLLREHGGVLDRFDALLYTAPWFGLGTLPILVATGNL